MVPVTHPVVPVVRQLRVCLPLLDLLLLLVGRVVLSLLMDPGYPYHPLYPQVRSLRADPALRPVLADQGDHSLPVNMWVNRLIEIFT